MNIRFQDILKAFKSLCSINVGLKRMCKMGVVVRNVFSDLNVKKKTPNPGRTGREKTVHWETLQNNRIILRKRHWTCKVILGALSSVLQVSNK